MNPAAPGGVPADPAYGDPAVSHEDVFSGSVGPSLAETGDRERPALPRPIIQVALVWIIGLSLGRVVLLPALLPPALALLLMGVVAAGLWRSRSFFAPAPTGGLLLLAALALLGMASSNRAVRIERRAAAQAASFSNAPLVRVEGIVGGMESATDGGFRLRLKRPLISVIGAAGAAAELALDAEVRVAGTETREASSAAEPGASDRGPADLLGARVRTWARPRSPDPPAHPWSFDASAFQRHRGVGAVFQVPDAGLLQIVETPPRALWALNRALDSIRGAVRGAVEDALPPELASLALAVLLGDRGKLTRPVVIAFRESGLMHLLVVSGFHASFVLAAALAMARAVRFPPRSWALVGLFALAAFTALVGFYPPVVRASVMGAFILGAWWLGRPTSTPAALAAAAFATLLADPRNLMRADWQLSYACVFCLSLLAPPIVDLFRALLRIGDDADDDGVALLSVRHLVYRYLAMPLASVLSILMGLLPFQAAYFGQIHLSGLVSNLLAMPLVIAVMVGALLMPLAGPLPGVGPLAAGLLEGSGAMLLGLARFFSGTLPLSVNLAPLPFALIAGYSLALVAGPHLLRGDGPFGRRTPSQRRHVAALLLGFLLLMAWLPLLNAVAGRRLLELYVLDVGQGDALVLRLPDKRFAVIDGGGGRFGGQGERTVVPFLRGLGAERLAFAAASHADADHIGGLDAVIEAFDPPLLLRGSHTASTEAWSEVLDSAKASDCVVREVGAGDRIAGLGPVSLRILGPWPGEERNNASLVMRVDYGSVSLLLTGDIEAPGEARLLAEAAETDVDVLKVPHHGSATSTTPEFLAAVSPDVALVSVGRANRFGHPSPKVIERLAAAGVVTARTDLSGTLRLQTDGRRIRLHAYGPVAP